MVTSVAHSIHAVLVAPPKTNYNLVFGVACFTLVCVEEDIDHITCWHSGTTCNCRGTSTMQLR